MGKFQEVISTDQPVLVEFYAQWCVPCKSLNPILKELAHDVGNRARILKIDVDKNQKTAMDYNIQGVPALVIFKKGEIMWRQIGVVQEKELLEQLKKLM